MEVQEMAEEMTRWAVTVLEEVEAAINEAARILAERVQYSIAEVMEGLSCIFSAGQSDFEALEEMVEEIDKELRTKQRRETRERERAQEQKRASAARFAQYRRQELKWTAGRRVRPRQREYKPP